MPRPKTEDSDLRDAVARTERLFVAVPLTERARAELVARLAPLPGRAVLPQNWHFTLRFLGDTEKPMRDALVGSLRATKLGPSFTIQFDELGAFPRARRARIIWLGVSDGAQTLVSLAEKVERAARSAGFPADQRSFKPHLTLSRIEPTKSVVELLAEQAPLMVAMPVTEVRLVRSELGSGPAKYETLEQFLLDD
jgi:RNA 2',3'-cyclic 3'-phosphodiesterase